MPDTTRRILLSCTTIIIAACLCLSALSITAAIFVLMGGSLEAEEPASNTAPQLDLATQMDIIQQQVITLRGLHPNTEVERALISPEQLSQRVLEDFFADYTAEEASQDAIVLWSFGLLERDADLLQIYTDLYSENILGFFDDETNEMVVVSGPGFQGAEQMTYAHEFAHALQDQNYDFDDGLGYSDEACETEGERCAALQALIEGDASLTEFYWYLDYATTQQVNEIHAAYEDYDFSSLDEAPPFLQEDLYFPYTSGQEFVNYLHENGGWEAVDAAYVNPPISTEQILHPERYPNDIPAEVILPDLSQILGPSWELLEDGILGEWYTLLFLAYGMDADAQLGLYQAEQAADGWGGDAYAVYQNTNDNVVTMVLSSVWDTLEDTDEFADAFQTYATLRFGDPGLDQPGLVVWEHDTAYTSFHYLDNQTIWIFAPDAATAEVLWEAIQNP